MKLWTLTLIIAIALTSSSLAAKLTPEYKNLTDALKSKLPIVVKLGAEYCPPCREMKPILKELAKEQAGKIIFLDLDIYQNRELAKEQQVRLIPTILFYDKLGKLKAKREGFMSKDELLKTVKELGLKK